MIRAQLVGGICFIVVGGEWAQGKEETSFGDVVVEVLDVLDVNLLAGEAGPGLDTGRRAVGYC